MNIKLRKKAKNNFEKDFFRLMNNAVFEKTMENVTQQKGVEFIQYQNQIIILQSFSRKICWL